MAENSGSNISVRKMSKSDLAKINAVDNSLHGKARVTTWPFTFDTYWRIYQPAMCYVAELNKQVVGFVAGVVEEEERSKYLVGLPRKLESPSQHYPKVGWIEMMGVHADHWGQGVGLALMKIFTEECKKVNASVRIVVRDDDEALKSFLAGMGFRKSEFVSYNLRTSE
ncbi:MAG: GNAT family N-acetyltransferase [Dehalococcoidales bacterium]|nr:GNAT family N-acetyltransferase [Dehalococcoidales bacterium]